MPKYQITGGYYQSQSIEASAQECINFYPQPLITKGALNDDSLLNTPGIQLFSNVGTEGSRGLYLFNDELYSFNGTTVYKISELGAVNVIGIIDAGERVSVADNGVVMTIVVPETGNGWFSDGSTVEPITDLDFAKPVRFVTYIDGTFTYVNDTEIFVGSVVNVNDGKDFEALDFGTAEIDPDPILSIRNIRNQLTAIGRHTIEVFGNAGDEGFPFQRITGANVGKGTASRFGFTEFNDGYVYVGSNRQEGNSVWYAIDNVRSKISTAPIDIIIGGLTKTEKENITLFTYSDGGNFFVCMELPTTTFVYDLTASLVQKVPIWHERKSFNNTTKWRITDSIEAYGKTMVADSTNGNIGFFNINIATEFDEIPFRTATGAYLDNEGIALFIDELELVGRAGVGDTHDVANANPQVFLSWSDDGGHMFTTPTSKGMGLKGQYNIRPIWRRLGRVQRSRVFRITWNEDKLFTANVLWIRGEGGI